MTSFDQLAAGLLKAAAEIGPAMRDTFNDSANEAKRGWQDNIRAVAPQHLPHAPKAITFETRVLSGSIVAEVGPEEGRLQANLVEGDEFGSRNQAPHLSGQKAVEPVANKLPRRADAVIGHLLP